ncbi:DUF3107 domain-containing protein [Jiangella aurantiaca]|uniref:DUF3107 domain-containing protein n=1 Tax=Jiangella aurantiaca TaxID=2530373 RepID=A0A4R5AA10_9ACTN|nr:DUF3107 domain-containing protein [Jiangella aurantiaca]TDD69123.1 DUF3107 domain-containing protein [Jiangella aurantiaca]
MEVKIGVHNATRELVLESGQSPKEIENAVREAMTDQEGLLDLVDERGRRVLVRTVHLTYVEIGEPVERRVGFGTV